MNFPLAREIYGSPWYVDQASLPALLGILNGKITFETPEIKHNTPFIFDIKNETRIITRPFGSEWNPGQLENRDDFEGIGVILIDGPITRTGGMSSLGMEQLSGMMLAMNADPRIKGFVILADSGGGASSAVEVMADTIKEVRKTKKVYGVIKKGGMAASAMFGILSACEMIFSEHEMNIVGSAGTMMQFEGRAANSEAPDGTKHIRLYATKSTKKNEGFEEALNNDNYTVLVDEILNPHNERFLDMILGNRPMLKGSNFDNGHTVYSKDAIGTFIDGIASFGQVVKMIESSWGIDASSSTQAKNKNKNNNNSNSNSKIMDVPTLRSEHPETHQSIFNAGVTAERNRVGAWMAWSAVDPDAVKAGIESGEEISPVQRETFIVKSTQTRAIANVQNDSAPDAASGESNANGQQQPTEAENFYAEVAKGL